MQKSYNEIQNEAIKIFHLEGKHPRNWSPADVQAVDSYVSRQISKQGMGGIDPRVAALYRNAGLDAMGRHQALQNLGAEQGASDAINNMWGDFGGGGGLGAYNPSYDPYVDDYTKDRDDERNQIRDRGETEDEEEESPETTNEEPEQPNPSDEAEEPGIGEDASKKPSKTPGEPSPAGEAPKTAPSLGEGAKTASNVAKVAEAGEGAGAMAGAAGAAGVGEAAAVTATAGAAAPEFLLVVIVLGVIFLVLIALWGIFAQNPGGSEDNGTNCISADGHVFPLPKDQVTYGDNFGDGRSDHLHSGTDIMHKKDLKVEVYAIVDGNIVSANTSSDGASLKLQSTSTSDKNYYFYTHFSSLSVSDGAVVKAGQLIGYSGGYNEGASGDHIHLSVGTTSDFKVNLPLGSGAAHGQTAAPSPYETTLNPYPILKALESGTSTCNTTTTGQYGLPVDPGVGFVLGSAFGPRPKPCATCSSNHQGQDINIPGAGDVGKPVYAVAAGTITELYYSSCALQKVGIDHGNGFTTRYLHLTKGSAGSLTVGSAVTAGQQIGTISESRYDSCSTGAHLHFETKVKGVLVNPVGVVDFSKL